MGCRKRDSPAAAGLIRGSPFPHVPSTRFPHGGGETGLAGGDPIVSPKTPETRGLGSGRRPLCSPKPDHKEYSPRPESSLSKTDVANRNLEAVQSPPGFFGLGLRTGNGEAPPFSPGKGDGDRIYPPPRSRRCGENATQRRGLVTRAWFGSVISGMPCRSRCVGGGWSRYHGSGRSPCTAFEMTGFLGERRSDGLWFAKKLRCRPKVTLKRLDSEELTRCSRCGYVPAPLPDKVPCGVEHSLPP